MEDDLESGGDGAYQRRLQKRYADAMRRQQMEEQRKEAVRQFLEPDAYDRLMNIRVSNPELYAQVVSLVLSLAQSGRLQQRMTEEQLKSFVLRLTQRPDSKIEFKRK